jgi:hypothetical protein
MYDIYIELQAPRRWLSFSDSGLISLLLFDRVKFLRLSDLDEQKILSDLYHNLTHMLASIEVVKRSLGVLERENRTVQNGLQSNLLLREEVTQVLLIDLGTNSNSPAQSQNINPYGYRDERR